MRSKNSHDGSHYRFLRSIPMLVSVSIGMVVVLAYIFYAPFREFLHDSWKVLTSGDRRRIEEWTLAFGVWGPLILMVFFLGQMFAFVLPSWLLIVVSILAYGPFLGGAIALGGIVFATTVAYVIGRSLNELALQQLVGKKPERTMKWYLNRYGFWVVVIFRLAPFLSNDIISYVAGLIAMSYPRFIGATVLGISPLIALIAYLGETTERLRTGFVVVSIVSLVGFAFYVWWDRKQMRKRSVV
ncbi:MAG: TVP38/TMEM64 family protein [Chitinivibrionales bacterium]|nr:TVP38/TMEM64 family protein [Chitinivibrionales bacterium]MBD3358070.1 TVP38/TMEM64 family protein [Chitinivibrionales bacterium]